MPRDPIARVDSDRGNLPIVDPHAGVTRRSAALQAVGRERSNEKLLNLPKVPVEIALVPLEVEDRISDELPGSMKRHVASPLDLVQLDAALAEVVG